LSLGKPSAAKTNYLKRAHFVAAKASFQFFEVLEYQPDKSTLIVWKSQKENLLKGGAHYAGDQTVWGYTNPASRVRHHDALVCLVVTERAQFGIVQ